MKKEKRFEVTVKIDKKVFFNRREMPMSNIISFFPSEVDAVNMLDVGDAYGNDMHGAGYNIKRAE